MPTYNDLAFRFPGSTKTAMNDKWMEYLSGSGQTYTSQTRPEASTVPAGTVIKMTDVNGLWEAKSYGWVPLAGSVVLDSNWGTVASPLQKIIGVATSLFTPSYTIPANLLLNNRNEITVEALYRKHGSTSSNFFEMFFGTGNDTSNSKVYSYSLAATDQISIRSCAVFTVHTNSVTFSGPLSDNVPLQGSIQDASSSINIAQDMKVQFKVTAGSINDDHLLVGYQITLKQA